MEAQRPATTSARRRRLLEELAEEGLGFVAEGGADDVVLEELDHALRPPVHEQRVPTYGVIIAPGVPPEQWSARTNLAVSVRPTGGYGDDQVRRFADGSASWAIRLDTGLDQFVVFDRPAGAERDLVVLAEAAGARIVQRGEDGVVRVVGPFGVVRATISGWHHEPPLSAWVHDEPVCGPTGEQTVLGHLLDFAVHDLGARHIGTLLVMHGSGELAAAHERRLPRPPELNILRPYDLAPLRHGLAQSDGASVFDAGGTLRWMGVHLTPSRAAEDAVAGFGGTKHTAGLRYSYDDPEAVVIAVSDDGPVTVMRAGHVVGRSPADGTVTRYG
ncbi:MAG: diadenylate cyclase [Acidimicrobiia bacterium]